MIAAYKNYEKIMKVEVNGDKEELAQELAVILTMALTRYPDMMDRIQFHTMNISRIKVEDIRRINFIGEKDK